METDQERQDRTGLSSLQITDQESAAVVKNPATRVSLADIEAEIVGIEYDNPDIAPTLTVCFVKFRNSFVVIGKSAPKDPGNYDEALGQKFAYEDAVRQAWPLFAFADLDAAYNIDSQWPVQHAKLDPDDV